MSPPKVFSSIKELPGDNMVFYGNVMFQGDCQTGNVPIQLQNGNAFGRVFLYGNTFRRLQ